MRCPRRVFVPLLLWLALPGAAPGQGARAGTESYEAVFDEVRNLAPRGDRVATVRNFVLRRDVAEFRLTEGTLQLLTDAGGRTVGAAFVGGGTLSLTPPLEVERAHLRRVMGDSTLDGPIAAVVFIFADSTLPELQRALTFGSGAPAQGAAGHVNDALGFLVDGRERRADATLMSALLNGQANGFFAAYVKRQSGEGVLFSVDPLEVEKISLLRRGRQPGQRVETVCQFQRAEDRRSGTGTAGERPEPLRVEAYRIESAIDGNYKFSAAATVRVTGRQPDTRWARFLLFSELDVDSVVTDGGAPATFFRRDGNTELWIRFDPAVQKGETRAIRVVYHGDLIGYGSAFEDFLPPWWDPARRRMPPMFDRWAYIKATETWYPRHGFWEPFDMDLTFHTPKQFRFASIGRLVESRDSGNVRTTRWVTEMPAQQASFNIGDFDEFEIKDPRIPPVTVQINKDAHNYIASYIPHARNPQQHVGADVANSLSFFTSVFGAPLFQRYYATEIPYFHGQAFPGLIHLSWVTYVGTGETGADESFRAHEMAHQWWGIGVEPAGYRDAWLSEGFAMFAGLWYMQVILRDNEKYFKQLREWRTEIRRQREEAPPIGLGTRMFERRPRDYDLIVYRKGAWVLHMLRNLMLDTRTMNEDAFTRLMQDFYQNHRGGHASTEDFQKVVERHLNRSMDWFFRQWVYGTAVPTYVFAWQTEPQSDGKYRLRLRIRQEDVPDDFAMFVPLLIELAGGHTFVRVNVRGPLTEAQLTVPEEPKRLELNPLESVLAQVRTESWR